MSAEGDVPTDSQRLGESSTKGASLHDELERGFFAPCFPHGKGMIIDLDLVRPFSWWADWGEHDKWLDDGDVESNELLGPDVGEDERIRGGMDIAIEQEEEDDEEEEEDDAEEEEEEEEDDRCEEVGEEERTGKSSKGDDSRELWSKWSEVKGEVSFGEEEKEKEPEEENESESKFSLRRFSGPERLRWGRRRSRTPSPRVKVKGGRLGEEIEGPIDKDGKATVPAFRLHVLSGVGGLCDSAGESVISASVSASIKNDPSPEMFPSKVSSNTPPIFILQNICF